MKYFTINTVANAYMGFQHCMTNKSWGYLAILRGCENSIRPSTPYKVNLDIVSNFLEDIFNLSQNKRKYDSARSLYVVFSNKWDQYFKEQGLEFPNIYDVIAWAYRRKAFPENITINGILSMFAKEFNIPYSIISNSFNTNIKTLEFTDSLYTESELKTILGKYGVNISRNNIDAKKESIVASPGEISRGPFIQTLYAGLDITDYVLILQSNYYSLYGNRKVVSEINYNKKKTLQQIYYGAPGTGKSYEINRQTKGHSVIRTTFHPDSDYSTFVGAYKPTMDGDKIVYKFIKQAFLKAYLSAWKKYVDGYRSINPTIEPQFLVIEEINRGNCAQIFGDIFQLLDRGDNNFSCYPIEVDTDIQKAIAEAFANEDEYKLSGELNVEGVIKDYTSSRESSSLSKDIREGRVMLLPPNLYIWATMNTSDQSLFPIDSAFKRRWSMKYVPIDPYKEEWAIEVGDSLYDWSSFLEKINKEIQDTTFSEDKKLGFYFCKADKKAKETDSEPTIITLENFTSKVLLYIYNDVFKDYGLEREFFKDNDSDEPKIISFDSMYKSSGDINEVIVKKLLDNLGVELFENEDEPEPLTSIKITFPNGLVIQEAKEVDTYVNVIMKIGCDKIDGLGIKFRGNPIVSKTQYPTIVSRKDSATGYYVLSSPHHNSRIRLLTEISEKLSLGLKIE